MRMDLNANSALREQGWRVFRSASRDHLVPLTGIGAVMTRLKISDALPVLGVFEGVALSDEERQARSEQDRLAYALAEREAVGRPLGVTQYLETILVVSTEILFPGVDSQYPNRVGLAPFDGFITEAIFSDSAATPSRSWAIRSSGGASMFRSFDNGAVMTGLVHTEPDFVNVNVVSRGSAQVGIRNLKMPVFAGEEIVCIASAPAATPVGTSLGFVMLGFEAFILARPGSQAAQSMFGALTVESRRAATEAAELSGRLQIEQERTRRALLVDAGATERAKLAVEARNRPTYPAVNPFNNLLLDPRSQLQLSSRLARPPAPPKVPAPKPQPPEGAGKTFVSAWNPTYGNIGYLVPNPPPGGRVNVFDSRYTVWDITGHQVGTGMIEPIATTGDIPEGARISPTKGGSVPSGL